MEHLIGLLNTLIGDPEMARLAFVTMIATAIGVMVLAVMFLAVGLADPVRRRLHRLVDHKPTHSGGVGGLTKLIESASPYILPKAGWERTRITTKLVHAGCRAPTALSLYYGTKVLLGVLIPVMVLVGATWLPQFTTLQVLFSAAVASCLGMMIPNAVLDHMVGKRMRLLHNAFPDALDMLVVCVEAGLGLAAAIQRVADELAVSQPELAAELALVNAEIRAGVDRVQALKNLGNRTGLEDIRGLVSLLAQTLRFGTSIADTLRVYAEEFRDKRMQRAEEQAAKIGTKLIFPLVVCIFPSFFLVAIGPAILGVLEVLTAVQFESGK